MMANEFTDVGSQNALPTVFNQLIEQSQSSHPSVQKKAVEELIYLLQSHDEDRVILTKSYELLQQLARVSQDPDVQKIAVDSLLHNPSPDTWFASLKRIKWTQGQRWHPHASDPDTILVPAGLFQMGSSKDTGVEIPHLTTPNGTSLKPHEYISEAVAKMYLEGLSYTVISYSDERPHHTAYLETFEIGVAPVTNSQFAVFIKDTSYQPPPHWPNGLIPDGSEELPVVYVSWFDAVEYCKWLTTRWRLSGRIGNDVEVRLPSEAQWEKAARGTEGRAYPWGNQFDPTLCNHRVAGFGEPIPVGCFPESSDSLCGCKDMAGNVWDWTLSIWGRSARKPEYKYPYLSDDGRESMQIDKRTRRVIRGGAFYSSFDCLRCAVRNRSYQFTKHESGGFRVAVAKTNVQLATSVWLSRKV